MSVQVRQYHRRKPLHAHRRPDGIPWTLYHGTPTKNVPSIREHGLRLGTMERASFPAYVEDVPGCIFLADTEKDARFFGLAAHMEALSLKKGRKKLDFTVLIIDSMMARMHGVPIVKTPGMLEHGPEKSGFEGEQYVACEDIPPQAIVGFIRVYQNEEGKVITERGRF